MKLLKCSLLLMASAATLLAPGLAAAANGSSSVNTVTPPPPKCAYPPGAVLPPPTTTISPGCPARPTSPASAGYQFVLLLNVWSSMPIMPASNGQGGVPKGSVTTTRFLAPKPIPKSYEDGMTEPSVVTSDVCLQEDNTWYALDGSISGSYSVTGNELSLSGNNDDTGESAVLTVLQPGVSMTGIDQQWSIADPTADQTVSTTIWTINSPSCGGE